MCLRTGLEYPSRGHLRKPRYSPMRRYPRDGYSNLVRKHMTDIINTYPVVIWDSACSSIL